MIEARYLAETALAGDARVTAIRRFAADQAPLELRRERPSWQAQFADGTHVYIDAETGEVLALRTRFWRAFDFMWGLTSWTRWGVRIPATSCCGCLAPQRW